MAVPLSGPLGPSDEDAGWWDDEWDPDSSCPPEYVGVPVRVVMAELDVEAEARAAGESREVLHAGFRSREPSVSGGGGGSGFGSGEVLDVLKPGPVLATMTEAATRDGGLPG
jgi:hypothetical protein